MEDDSSNCDGAERRQWPRLQLCVQVRLRFTSAEAVVQSQTFDLSQGGAFIRIANPRPIGTQVRLVVDVGSRQMVIGGTVVRTSDGGSGPPGMGIAFTEMSADDQTFVGQLVAAREGV